MSHAFDVTSASSATWSTRVVVGSGLLGRAARAIARTYPSFRPIVVSDARVARLYGRDFARRLISGRGPTALLTFPPGERSKTRETKARLENRLVATGAGRDTVVIALGGGVTGDLAGFLAATWHRGVPVVQIPTTTLAMIDAAIGGKTGVDLPQGKNLVGAFHQPDALWADVAVLGTLPGRTYRAGLAEAVKIAAAQDAPLFGWMERNVAALAARDERALVRLIARCLALKGSVVAGDERESGRRALLNFGHTVAHALEAASAFRIPHGLAVAIGLVAEARLAARVTGLGRGDADRIEALVRALGLPVRPPPGLDPRRLTAALLRDKKSRQGVVRCTLPLRLGTMPAGDAVTVAVDPARDLLPLLDRN